MRAKHESAAILAAVASIVAGALVLRFLRATRAPGDRDAGDSRGTARRRRAAAARPGRPARAPRADLR